MSLQRKIGRRKAMEGQKEKEEKEKDILLSRGHQGTVTACSHADRVVPSGGPQASRPTNVLSSCCCSFPARALFR